MHLVINYNGYLKYMEKNYIGPNSVGAIRLLNTGSTSLYNTAGLVQVWYDGHWGNVCATNGRFTYFEADVICHQLGWSGASSQSTGHYDRLVVYNNVSLVIVQGWVSLTILHNYCIK